MRIVYVRHGEDYANLAHRLPTLTAGYPLTKKGWESGSHAQRRFLDALSAVIKKESRQRCEVERPPIVVGHYGLFWPFHRGLLVPASPLVRAFGNCSWVELTTQGLNPVMVWISRTSTSRSAV